MACVLERLAEKQSVGRKYMGSAHVHISLTESIRRGALCDVHISYHAGCSLLESSTTVLIIMYPICPMDKYASRLFMFV